MVVRRKKPWAEVDPIRLGDLIDADESALRAGSTVEAMRFGPLDVAGRDLSGVTFVECALAGVGASETQLRGAAFVDSHLDRVDAAVFRAARSRFRDVVLRDSRLGSAELYDTSWDSVLVVGCKLGFVNFRNAQLTNAIFEDCLIDELDLSGASAVRVTFRNTRIDALDVTDARLETVDLRGAELRRVVSLANLRGATMSTPQLVDLAPIFADHFGIHVID